MSDAEVQVLNRKMDRILLILENDDHTETKGLVSQVADIRRDFHKFVADYNIDMAVKRGKDTVWKIVWGFIGALVLKLLSLLF